jgi:DNA helicase-2/ATP-dependent DNA helicase PcrA
VIIPDADEASYPDTPVARRTLHIAATRAVHQLWVVSVGRTSPILSFAKT